ncbi:hypothetical protein, partial [Xanthovirga aplysinae]|uniref:hypothetical protein n=1 Tax=Xanthovirga aplysinae TaxID=2529853 RepID=UPI001656DA76
YSLNYNLLISTPASKWYQPVAYRNVSVDKENDDFPDQTIESKEHDSMISAAFFLKTLQVFPDGELSFDFYKALRDKLNNISDLVEQGKVSPNDFTQLQGNIDSFFQNSDDFKDVTFSSLISVQGYFTKFPFVWASYAAVTYFLYFKKADGSVAHVGNLKLEPPTVLTTATVLNAQNGGYQIKFENIPGKGLELSQTEYIPTYSAGMFTLASPEISLIPSFQRKDTFTGNPTDTDVVVSITGTVGGHNVTGFNEEEEELSVEITKAPEPPKPWFEIGATVLGGFTFLWLTISKAARVVEFANAIINREPGVGRLSAAWENIISRTTGKDQALARLEIVLADEPPNVSQLDDLLSARDVQVPLSNEFAPLVSEGADIELAPRISRIMNDIRSNRVGTSFQKVVNATQEDAEALKTLIVITKDSSIQQKLAVQANKLADLQQEIASFKASDGGRQPSDILPFLQEKSNDITQIHTKILSIQEESGVRISQDLIQKFESVSNDIASWNEIEQEASQEELDPDTIDESKDRNDFEFDEKTGELG